ncbi:unnamed protein product [Rotaria sp. Silwood1]|nr:unnamed protein product [Rotaria sp. Silwood1]
MINTNPTVESIAKVLSSMGECEKARKYYEMTLQNIPSNDVFESDLALVYSETGRVHLSLKEYDQSLMYLEMALDTNNRSPYVTKKSLIARNYYDIGVVLYEKGTDDDKALEAFRNALNIYDKLLSTSPEILAKLHDNIAMIHCRRKKWNQAMQTYTKSCQYRFGEKH